MLKREKYLGSLCAALCLTTFLALMTVQPASATVFPGPDEFGYFGMEIARNLRDISATGTFVPLGDDELSGAIEIPFLFQFYGDRVSYLYICSNGFVTFASTTCSLVSQPIPTPPTAFVPSNLIAGFWEDLNFPQGNIRFETLGSPGNREFVVGFYNVPHFNNGPQVTFEIILHEAGSAIELQYGSAPSDGGTHSVGIENADGTIGLQVARGNVSFNNQGYLITGVAPFKEFKVTRAHVTFREEPKGDKYDVEGEFVLSEFSDGIDPVAEDVVVAVGTSTLAIPAGSFRERRGRYEFSGPVGDVFLEARIQAGYGGAFRYRLEARGVDLTKSAIPMDIFLKIGDDQSITTFLLYGELQLHRKGRRDHDRDDHDHRW
ncbi:MAG: hypothetical protein ACM335_08475 [Deltaproteobacteria bacterium]